MRDLLRALHRRYLTRGLTREERSRLDALPAPYWPTPGEFTAAIERLQAGRIAQLDSKVRARVAERAARGDAYDAARAAGADPLQATELAGILPGDPAPTPVDPLSAARDEIATGLVPATRETVGAALYPPPALPEEDLARIHQGDRERRALAELDRMRTEHVRYVIDYTREQWLTLVRHGIDPTHPLYVDGGLTVVGTVPPAQGNGFLVVDVPRRKRVCELDGVEIDGHAPSDLDPCGGCLYCGKEDIYGDEDYLAEDPEEREPDPLSVECPTCEASDGVPCRPLYLDLADLRGPVHPARTIAAHERYAAQSTDPEDVSTWPFAEGCAR
jgi:hypothetical protein